jgi:uncharacterized protein
MENRSLHIIVGSFILALTILISTFLVTSSMKEIKFGQGTIHVKGCAEKEIKSDFVKWQGTISASAETLPKAFEKLEKDLETIKKFITEKSIKIDQVAFSPISTSTTYQINSHGNTTNTIESYILSQDFTISSPNLLLITQVAQEITSLIKDDLSIRSYPPQFFYSKIDELKIMMLGEAAKDAMQRAEVLVTNSGSKVGSLKSAQQGVFQITPAYSNSVSDYGEYDTSSIVKRIKAVVTMEYTIN